MLSFNHMNFNVSDMDRSIAFYREALDLCVLRDRTAEDGRWRIVFLGDNATQFRLELTALRDHPQKYDLGEEEFHLAFTANDFEQTHARHAAMGCICMENKEMGIYFISDPDGYWLEIVPARR